MGIKHNLEYVFRSDVPWKQVEVADGTSALAVFPCSDYPGFISSEIKAGR